VTRVSKAYLISHYAGGTICPVLHADRPRVKLECLRLLATLRLDPARTRLISGFIDTYLQLNAHEAVQFHTALVQAQLQEQEVVMEIVTSWMREGLQQGKHEEALALVLRLL
jgi:hypothetical protein